MELGSLQKAWIAALRSGEYEQGKDFLCKNNKYCCLGVACHAVLKLPFEGGHFTVKQSCTIDSALSHGAYELLGLFAPCGDAAYELAPHTLSLTGWNDNGRSFNQIADLLEQHPEWYFKESK